MVTIENLSHHGWTDLRMLVVVLNKMVVTTTIMVIRSQVKIIIPKNNMIENKMIDFKENQDFTEDQKRMTIHSLR